MKDWSTGATIVGGKVTEVPPYVTFTAAEAQTFKMTTEGKYAISWLEYSLDGNEWTAVEKDKKVEFGGTKGSLHLRGRNLNGTASSSNNYSTTTSTNPDVKVACTGDIRTLLNCASYKTVETKDAKFCNLFYDCTQLTSAPELPATQLASYCYNQMFRDCTNLTSVTMLASKDYFKDDSFNLWLFKAGTNAASSTL